MNPVKITEVMPHLREVVGPNIGSFPDGFDFPLPVILRHAYVASRDAHREGKPTEVTVPGYGVVNFTEPLWHGASDYVFEATPEYAKHLGFTRKVGTW
jgi:hypothetical protein